MKTNRSTKTNLMAAGFSIAIAMCTGTASAEDFNPQPDPPGKAQTVVKGAHNRPDDKGVKGQHIPPADKGQHNPPGDKTGAADKATGIPPGFKAGAVDKATGIPPGFKTDKTKKLDAPTVGAIDGEKK